MTGVETKDRIRSAALEVFAERGFAAASTVEIARRAGTAQPTVHYHFGSKRALFDDIVERELSRWTEALAITPDLEGADPLLQLETTLRRFGYRLFEMPLLSRLIYIASTDADMAAGIGAILHPGFAQFASLLEPLVDGGVVRDIDPVVIAEAFSGVLSEIAAFATLHEGVHGRDFTQPEVAHRFVNDLVDLLLFGLVPR